MDSNAHITVKNLTLAYDDNIILKDLNFSIEKKKIFVIMGGSGCGKTTLMRALIGLLKPTKGEIFINDKNLLKMNEEARDEMARHFGIAYQNGALWSSMTLAENVALPLEYYSNCSKTDIEKRVRKKLALVGLKDFAEYYPADISGGMRKRAGLARAMALDPEILFFDEPSAGLDPLTSRRLDDLILQIRDQLGTTIVVVSHELASIFAIADDSIFLDGKSKTQLATGNPKDLLESHENPIIHSFLTRELVKEEAETQL